MEGFEHYRPSSQIALYHNKKYHVFLSFRGPDVRRTLVDHLYQSLSTAGLHVFLDSEKLLKGDVIGISLEEAIQNSTVHIPIFSTGYATSAWCLQELSLIWTCKSACNEKRVIPLFYDVEPSDVRYPDQKGPYAEAFVKHYEKGRHSKEEIAAWKDALHQVSSFSGWSLVESASG